MLFDIDGTLLKTGGAGIRAMRSVIYDLFGNDLTWEGVTVSGHLDPLIFAELMEINGIDPAPSLHEQFRDAYLERLGKELQLAGSEVLPLPGVHETLSQLRKRRAESGDVTLGLLTGNYTRAVPIKLRAVGLDPDWFEITSFGDEAATRPDLVKLAMDKYERHTGQRIHPSRVVVIGDTPRDVRCAHSHGCTALAVATGRYSTETLREIGADLVVDDLSDPSVLIDLIEHPLSESRCG